MEAKRKEILTCADDKALKRKRKYRQEQAAKVTTYLQTHEDTPILSLVMSDLKSNLNIIEASLEYFPIIQNRIDQLEEPDNPDELEQAVQEYIESMEAAKHQLQEKMEAYKPAKSLSTVVRDIDSALKLGSFDTIVTQNKLTTLSEKINQLVDVLGDYDHQPGIDDLVSLAETKRESFYEQVNIASKAKESIPPLPSIPVAVKPESRKRIQVEAPSFDGDPLNWAPFLRRFKSVLSQDKSLIDEELAELLVKAMKDKRAKEVAERAANSGGYSRVLVDLDAVYNNPRSNFPLRMEQLYSYPQKTDYDKWDFMQLMATLYKHVEGLKDLDAFTIDHVIGYFATRTFTERTK